MAAARYETKCAKQRNNHRQAHTDMSNRAALGLFLGLLLTYGIAQMFVDDLHVFLGRKFLELIQWLAFWR